MREATGAWPAQLPDALDAARRAVGAAGARSGQTVRAVVAFGVGTGGAACDAAAAISTGRLAVPFVVRHDAAVPAAVGPDTLVLAVACGESPEAVDAARRAHARGARVVGIGNSPSLAQLAAGASMPWCEVGTAGPTGRAAFAPATVAVLGALGAGGLLPDLTAEAADAATFVAARLDSFGAERGAAAELARRIGRTIPLVYGSVGVAGVAARWWKSSVNLNAKSPAFAGELPAAAYDEVAGWGQGGDVTRQTMTLVFLRHHGEAAETAGLFAAVRSATEEVMADVLEVWADGRSDLERCLELALLGELVSLEMAAREGVDPGPVPAVEAAIRSS